MNFADNVPFAYEWNMTSLFRLMKVAIDHLLHPASRGGAQ